MRILLVEDDPDLGPSIKSALKLEGYTVDLLADGKSAYHALESEYFNLLVLDLGIPSLTGFQVLQKLRAKEMREKSKPLPVLILTARDAIEDRVKGLDFGADDYLTKPFELDELHARVRALLRRSSERAETVIKYRNIELDPASHTVKMDGELMNVPRREFSLLMILLENIGHVLSREQLTQTIYGWDEEDPDSNALEVHIHNLRKKLKADFIRTIRGVGYLVEKENKN